MVRFVDSFQTQQRKEREFVREGRNKEKNLDHVPRRVPSHTIFNNKQRSLSPESTTERIKHILLSDPKVSNNSENIGGISKTPHVRLLDAKFSTNVNSDTDNLVHNVKNNGRSVSCGAKPLNHSEHFKNLGNDDDDCTDVDEIRDVRITNSIASKNKSHDHDTHIDLFEYEESLGDEKWEDELPHLCNSPLVFHSRLRFPSPLLCDTTRPIRRPLHRNHSIN